jgi:hypothetical protein
VAGYAGPLSPEILSVSRFVYFVVLFVRFRVLRAFVVNAA